MYLKATDRLIAIWSELQNTNRLQSTDKALVAFADILYSFCRLLLQHRGRHTVARFVAQSASSRNLWSLHDEIDDFMEQFGVNREADIHNEWESQWACDQEDQSVQLHAALENVENIAAELTGKEDILDAVAHLQHLLSRHGRQETKETAVIKRVVQRLTSGNDQPQSIPTWFLSRFNVEVADWNAASKGRFILGSWLKSAVMVSKCEFEIPQFETTATAWEKLRHPNVMDLFGACHVGQPRFFACASSSNGTLYDYLRNHGGHLVMFIKLHEAAQRMIFLRERSIVHGDLTTANMLIGNDDKAKIGGFELGAVTGSTKSRKVNKGVDRSVVSWKAPELQRGESPTFASDTYAFGICILDVLTTKKSSRVKLFSSLPYLLRTGNAAPPPDTLSSEHWSLIKEMCAPNPRERPPLEYVVANLERFIAAAKVAKDCERPGGVVDDKKMASGQAEDIDQLQQLGLESWTIAEFSATIADMLQELQTKCRNFPESQDMAEHILSRLQQVYALLLCDQVPSTDSRVCEFVDIIRGFNNHFRTALTTASVACRLRSQQLAFGHNEFHLKIDRLLNSMNVAKSEAVWQWELLHEKHVAKLSSSILEGPATRHVTTASQLVTFNNINSIKYGALGTSAVTIGRADSASTNRDWLIHPSEIECNKDDHIAEGGFGRIFCGVWSRRTQVVVKFLNKDSKVKVSNEWFLHEVEIWYTLQYPHVVRLYGACNTGIQFFVCEYASKGTLNGYLTSQVTKMDSEELRRLKWKLLHEAALGLQYVHEMNVIHNDLKCDNILIGDNGSAKLTGFGLSSKPHEAELSFTMKERMGAIQWKAPEYIKTGKPSFVSGIYSFAMCILEGITGGNPWGGMIDAAVKYKVRKRNIPLRPADMDDTQWSLIEMMTRQDPAQRLNDIFTVVDKLQKIATAGEEMLPQTDSATREL